MLKENIFNTHVEEYEQWYTDHQGVYLSELEAIREQLNKLPENLRGIEVGVGTGRFAKELGIKEGIEPSVAMAEKAIKRGIEIMKGVAEHLPYRDLHLDFVLFVTICYLKNFKDALLETHRVLKPKGSVIIGFLDREQEVAKEYLERRHRSTFYGQANFYKIAQIKKYLKEAGFKDFEFNQTLFGDLDSIQKVQLPEPGYGKGSFVVVKATKR